MQNLKLGLSAAFISATAFSVSAKDFLNVSYDPTRELYDNFNKDFGAYWKKTTGQDINYKQSHGGSGKQARAVIDGLDADVVTLALAADIDEIAARGLVAKDWQKKFHRTRRPIHQPLCSLVRKGNPKGIKDWGDLIKPGVDIITPNPKTSGGARWNYLAAWAWARTPSRGVMMPKPKNLYVKFINKPKSSIQVHVVQRLHLLNVALVTCYWLGKMKRIWLCVNNRVNLKSLPHPSPFWLSRQWRLLKRMSKKDGNENLAKAYLNYLYSPAGQTIAAQNYYRPRNAAVLAKYKNVFKPLKLVTIDKEFGGWGKVQKKHFENGGVFDQIVKPIIQNNA